MVKLAKRDKRKHLKAQVYFTYGKFLYGIKKDVVESKKFLRKSQTLFKTLDLAQGYGEVNKFIEEKLNKTEEEMPDSEDINTT